MAEKRSSGWLKWAIIILAVGGGRWLAASLVFSARTRLMRRSIKRRTVARGELTQVVTATGTLNPVVNVTVGSQVSGIISKLYVDLQFAW